MLDITLDGALMIFTYGILRIGVPLALIMLSGEVLRRIAPVEA